MKNSPEYNQSEQPAIELFQKLAYKYIHAKEITQRDDISQVILADNLRAAIRRINPWMNSINQEKAFTEITSVAGNSLMEINQGIWELLRGESLNLKQEIEGKENFHAVSFIDYQNPDNNEFLVINQLRYKGKADNSIPDIMLYVNGLPLVLIECKSPSISDPWDSAYNDLAYYQGNSEKLFHYNQICVALWKTGAKYGAIASPKQFYSVFRTSKDDKLPSFVITEQDILIYSLFEKNRFLDIIRNFVIFEAEEGRVVKKLPRYQQLRATNKCIARLQSNQGGVVWHTQGSGKSITMAYVTRKLQAKEYGFDNPTVVIMTDRTDLDRQICNTFRNIGFKNVSQAGSVVHLDSLLRNDYGGIITTTIHKFQESESGDSKTKDKTQSEEQNNIRVEKQISGNTLVKITRIREKEKWVVQSREEIILEELSTKKNLYVLVDEAHRSQYGFLASFMRTVLPHAKFIAFTGTPISNDEKSTLGEFYGGEYIDVYTITQSVADGATVELRYDEGIAKLSFEKDKLDKEFKEKFGHLSEEKQDKLKSRALRDYQYSAGRIREIAKHIIDNYRNEIYADGHKAMIVCSGREGAIKYKKALEKLKHEGYHHFNSKVVVSLGSPKIDHIAKEYYETINWNKDNRDKPSKPIWVTPSEQIKDVTESFKLPFGDEKETEISGKQQYDNTAFLIVSDMLLTGYDAPIASCLYLDKPLKEHNLLQAIARVNRTRKGKNSGFIVDYNGITANLIEALEIFSGDVKPDDILKNINEELPHLETNHAKILAFFKPIKVDRKYCRDEFVDKAGLFIEPIDKIDEFKMLLKQFNKSVNIVLPNVKALKYESDFKLFNEIRLRAKDNGTDMKVSPEESKMLQAMIDEHLKASGVSNLLEEPVSIIDKDKFQNEIMNASPATKELKMKNKLKHIIKVGLDKNPDFFKPLAERLEELLKQKKEERISQLDILLEYAKLQDTIIDNASEGESKGFTTERQRAVYDSMKTIFNGDAQDATHSLFDLIDGELGLVDWSKQGRVKKEIENKLKRFLTLTIGKDEAKRKAKELVDVMIKNKDE